MSDRDQPRRSALAAHASGEHAWWETAISDVSPGRIVLRGHHVQDLIGEIGFVQHLVLLATGRLLSAEQARLIEAAMVAGADHGPRAPSIAAARMAATCGITVNSAVATGINTLGTIHGGAAADAVQVLADLLADGDADLDASADRVVADHRSRRQALPGFGHQLHDLDPRRAPLLGLIEAARGEGHVDGRFLQAALAVEAALERHVGRPITINVDGLWAIVCGELELSPDFAMGAFCLSRGAGIVAHVLEESASGLAIKGPCPPGDDLVRYTGPEPDGDASGYSSNIR